LMHEQVCAQEGAMSRCGCMSIILSEIRATKSLGVKILSGGEIQKLRIAV
jgi:hypothetical protein